MDADGNVTDRPDGVAVRAAGQAVSQLRAQPGHDFGLEDDAVRTARGDQVAEPQVRLRGHVEVGQDGQPDSPDQLRLDAYRDAQWHGEFCRTTSRADNVARPSPAHCPG